jgi:hypothetical protein
MIAGAPGKPTFGAWRIANSALMLSIHITRKIR